MYIAPEGAPAAVKFAAAEQGVKESPGGVFHPRIREYFWATSLHPGDDSVAWCSAFVNFCVKKTDGVGTGSAAARSWARWGVAAKVPALGDVVVFWRERKDGPLGHVGFYVGETTDDILVLGGNQHDAVCVAPYPKKRLLAVRRAQ